MPQAITIQDVVTGRNARHRKRYIKVIVLDQHKRKYVVHIDKESEAPVGLISRMFSAPDELATPYKYYRYDFENNPKELFIDYAQWARDEQTNAAETDVRLFEAHRRLKPGSDPTEDGISPAARQIVLGIDGIHPKQRAYLIALAARNDAWCLGFQRNRTPAVEAVIGKARKQAKLPRGVQRDPSLALPPELEAMVTSPSRVDITDEEDVAGTVIGELDEQPEEELDEGGDDTDLDGGADGDGEDEDDGSDQSDLDAEAFLRRVGGEEPAEDFEPPVIEPNRGKRKNQPRR
jgi:hypothetical protein